MDLTFFFLKKFAALICSLFTIVTLTFFLMMAAPGDPFIEEQSIRKDMQSSMRQHYGLDRSWIVQYQDYLTNLFQGNLGYSLKYPGRSVSTIIREGFSISAILGVQAFLLATTCGIILGICSTFYSHQWQENFILVLNTISTSIPSFLLAALLQYLFAIQLHLLPLARWGTFEQSILPTIALALAPMAFITRLTRSGMKEVLQTDYIRLARAKGLPPIRWMIRHALPNALLPILSYLGQLLANILVGSFIIEKLFSIPGLGQWFILSVGNRDYPLIMGLTIFYSAILLISVFAVDMLYGVVDPRIRLRTKG